MQQDNSTLRVFEHAFSHSRSYTSLYPLLGAFQFKREMQFEHLQYLDHFPTFEMKVDFVLDMIDTFCLNNSFGICTSFIPFLRSIHHSVGVVVISYPIDPQNTQPYNVYCLSKSELVFDLVMTNRQASYFHGRTIYIDG